MGPGFKYHVVTVAAIFFALTVGLVVGSLFVSPQVADQQKRALRLMQTKLDKDLDSQKRQIKRYEEFVNSVAPALLRGKLTGSTVAVLITGDYPEALAQVRESLHLADAKLLSITTIAKSWDRPDALLSANLAQAKASDPTLPPDRAGLCAALAQALAKGGAEAEATLTALDRADLVSSDRTSDYQTPAQYIVIIAGSRSAETDRIGNVDKPLIEALQKQKLTVVMGEPEDALASDIAAYHALEFGLATIDNVNTDIGGCALVFALLGDKDDYGVKVTAKRLLPPLFAQQN